MWIPERLNVSKSIHFLKRQISLLTKYQIIKYTPIILAIEHSCKKLRFKNKNPNTYIYELEIVK